MINAGYKGHGRICVRSSVYFIVVDVVVVVCLFVCLFSSPSTYDT